MDPNVRRIADERFRQWAEQHGDARIGLPIKGRLYGALVVLSQLESGDWAFNALDEAISTDVEQFFGMRSIRGHTASRIANVLRDHGRQDLTPSGAAGEQGRTSTGTKIAGLNLIALIRDSLDGASDLDGQGSALVAHLYSEVLDLLTQHAELGGIEIDYRDNETISSFIKRLAETKVSNPGALLQHLVGAKLELRYQGTDVPLAHNSASTADIQTGRLGDFEIGGAVFHVTKTPTPDHIKKAVANARSGRKTYILTTAVASAEQVARENFDDNVLSRIEIFALDQFIAQNLDEIAVFSKAQAVNQLQQLIERYNALVERWEGDKSLIIQMPDFGKS